MRLVDADELMIKFEAVQKEAARHGREFASCFYDHGGEVSTNWYCVEDMVDNAPTVDAIPVVRCKNCKYSDGGTDEDGKLFLKCLGWVYGGTREDDFCSHGERNERKDGDEHETD